MQKYKLPLKDANGVLGEYYCKIKIPGCEIVITGNTLTIYSSKPLSGEDTVQVEQTLPTELEMYGVSEFYSSTGIQPLFTMDSNLQKGDPIHCYFKLKSEMNIEGKVTITDRDSRN